MASLNFPPFTDSDPNPINGDVWTAPNGTQWEYDENIPAWKALANPGPGIRYRGGIDISSNPNQQYNLIESGNLFVVTTGANSVGTGYPGLTGQAVPEGSEVIFDGTEWQYIAITIPYATKNIAGKIEIATLAEAELGDDDTKAITPQTAKRSIPLATTSVTGRVQLATRNETEQAAREDRAVTPYGLSNIIQLIAANTANQVPVGMIMWYSDNEPPDGWMICDGSRVYETGDTLQLYLHLKQVNGKPWSTDKPWANGDVVRVPDLRGRFIRGNNLGIGRDPADPSFGEAQNDQFEEHSHSIDDPGHDHDFTGYKRDDGENRLNKAIIDDERQNDDIDDNRAVRPNTTGIDKTENTGGVENRPKNLNLLPCIKL